MQFKIEGKFKDNTYNLMRKTGYYFQGKDYDGLKMSFTRPASGYPRFHIYLKEENSKNDSQVLIFNLHLDQKKQSYRGVAAHSGEYLTLAVKEEAERIKDFLKKL